MLTFRTTMTVHASAAEAFDAVATNVASNQPRWEKEVVEVRLLTPGPIDSGSRAVMVRRGMGRTREVEHVVVEHVPHERIVFVHPDDRMEFRLSYSLQPLTDATCDLTVVVQARLKGALAVLEPLMRRSFVARGRRITAAMLQVIEQSAGRRVA